jgi:hypothetical protein
MHSYESVGPWGRLSRNPGGEWWAREGPLQCTASRRAVPWGAAAVTTSDDRGLTGVAVIEHALAAAPDIESINRQGDIAYRA